MAELRGVGRYEVVGAGPAVVILSNPQADPGWWAAPLVTALTAAGFQAVSFVHTGPEHEPGAVARDVAALISHLGVGPAFLVGWSQGAAIAQEVALRHPDLVAAAALIAGYARRNAFDLVLADAWAALDEAGPELDPVRLALLFLTSHPVPELGDDTFVEPLLAGMRRWSARGPSDARDRSKAFLRAYEDRRPELATLRVPCLVMGFELDADTFVTRAREVAEAIPGSRYVELPGAAHLAPITEPARVFGPIVEFLLTRR